MDLSKQKENMLNAVTELKKLLELGLLGNFTWFEAVEVIAFSPTQNNGGMLVRNIFSIYVAESGEPPPKPEQDFLEKKSKRLKGLENWSFRVTKRPVGIEELLGCIEHYGLTETWIPPGQNALEVGGLVAAPPMFCPPDERIEIPLNAVLKNNFWSGSYVVELKDERKSTLLELVREDARFEELSEWLITMLPLNIARVPDRIGDVLFQVPSNALIAELRHGRGKPANLYMDWHPEIVARSVVGEYRVEQDGLIVSLERFELSEGSWNLDLPLTSGDLRFSVWDSQKQRLLAATGVVHTNGGKWRIESSTSTSIEQPRQFELLSPEKTLETHVIGLMEPEGGWRRNRQPGSEQVNWRATRELKTRMKQLVTSRKFLQYGGDGNANLQKEHRRALDDIRQLIRAANQGAIYLWDPYLSANDILNTLAFCTEAGTELLGLTSAKPSRNSPLGDKDNNDADTTVTNDRKAWIKNQKHTLDTAFTGPAYMKLEFRMSWGIQGSFHDRFLILPSVGRGRTRVWSLGASINHIGGQHCIVQEVDYPEPVLQTFRAFWDQSDQSEHLIWKYS